MKVINLIVALTALEKVSCWKEDRDKPSNFFLKVGTDQALNGPNRKCNTLDPDQGCMQGFRCSHKIWANPERQAVEEKELKERGEVIKETCKEEKDCMTGYKSSSGHLMYLYCSAVYLGVNTLSFASISMLV